METVAFVLAIMGCGDAGGLCTQARVEPVRYTSIQACQAAAPIVLARQTDLDFPEISAQCRRTGMQMAQQDARPRG